MITFANTIHVNRPATDVYAYLSDLEHTPEWNWAITETEKTSSGPIAAGTRYRQTRSVPQRMVEYIEIADLRPHSYIEVEGTLAGLPTRLSYDIEETGDGTRVTNNVRIDPRGPLRLMAPALSGRIKRAVADNLGALKVQLEKGTHSGP